MWSIHQTIFAFQGAWRVEGRRPSPVDSRAIGSRRFSVRRLRTAATSMASPRAVRDDQERPGDAEANPRLGEGVGRDPGHSGSAPREDPRVVVGLLYVGRDGAATRRLPRRKGARAPHVRSPHRRAGGRAAGAFVGRHRLAQPPGRVPAIVDPRDRRADQEGCGGCAGTISGTRSDRRRRWRASRSSRCSTGWGTRRSR